MTEPTGVTALWERALDQTGRIVTGVRPDQLDLPTPCSSWSVRTVIGHLVRGNQNLAAVCQGHPRQPDPVADVGDDVTTAYRESAMDAKRAWREHGRLDGTYQTPLGDLPGAALLTLRLADTTAHGWDLARATDQVPHFDEAVVQAALAFAQTARVSGRLPDGAFAPAVLLPENAPSVDRLAALLGRDPWLTRSGR